ncbi:LOW QUALITY PROTEIN: hypothetical protein U0070_004810, partial [Myodes glareolus]
PECPGDSSHAWLPDVQAGAGAAAILHTDLDKNSAFLIEALLPKKKDSIVSSASTSPLKQGSHWACAVFPGTTGVSTGLKWPVSDLRGPGTPSTDVVLWFMLQHIVEGHILHPTGLEILINNGVTDAQL